MQRMVSWSLISIGIPSAVEGSPADRVCDGGHWRVRENGPIPGPWPPVGMYCRSTAGSVFLGAGKYSGDYTVEDTGGKVDEHHIDVFMPSLVEAKKFGRQRVKVVVLSYGDDRASPPVAAQKTEAKLENREVRKQT